MTKTFRAAYFVAADGQSDVLLTSEDQANLPENDLRSIAINEAGNAGLDLDGGTIHIGDYTTRWG